MREGSERASMSAGKAKVLISGSLERCSLDHGMNHSAGILSIGSNIVAAEVCKKSRRSQRVFPTAQ